MSEDYADNRVFLDPGRTIGPVPARHPITGRIRTLEENRIANDPRVIGRREGWEQGRFLGETTLTKDGRTVSLHYDQGVFMSGTVFSDTDTSDANKTTNVTSSPMQVRAFLRGTRCTCGPRTIRVGKADLQEHFRSRHEDSCPLGALS